MGFWDERASTQLRPAPARLHVETRSAESIRSLSNCRWAHGWLRSGQVAEAAGVNVQTLLYYERRGLLAEPARTLGWDRLYPPETVTVLRVIKAA